jgi:hypothetical protein
VKEVFYVAHPVTGDPEGNAYRAIAWIKWLTINDPSRVYVSPWVAEVLAFARENADKAFYQRVLADDCEVVRHLDGILCVGGTISTGMALELDAAIEAGKKVVDWHCYATPDDVPEGFIPGDFIPSKT